MNMTLFFFLNHETVYKEKKKKEPNVNVFCRDCTLISTHLNLPCKLTTKDELILLAWGLKQERVTKRKKERKPPINNRTKIILLKM